MDMCVSVRTCGTGAFASNLGYLGLGCTPLGFKGNLFADVKQPYLVQNTAMMVSLIYLKPFFICL